MKVLKFGGTSVGSVKSILSLKRIVENEAKKQSVVVVVAPSEESQTSCCKPHSLPSKATNNGKQSSTPW